MLWAALLKLKCAEQSLGSLLKYKSLFYWVSGDPTVCICNKHPVGTDDAGPRATVEQSGSKVVRWM